MLRAFKLCSSARLRQTELDHLRNVFSKTHSYPLTIINNRIDKSQDGILSDRTTDHPDRSLVVTLPYKGTKSEALLRSIRKAITCNSDLAKMQIVYKSRKLSSTFQLKDPTPIEHQHNVVYKVTCPENICKALYIGETARRLISRIIENGGKDSNSHVLKHSVTEKHLKVNIANVKILTVNHSKLAMRKILESLYIRHLAPSLNVQEMSVPLQLFQYQHY